MFRFPLPPPPPPPRTARGLETVTDEVNSLLHKIYDKTEVMTTDRFCRHADHVWRRVSQHSLAKEMQVIKVAHKVLEAHHSINQTSEELKKCNNHGQRALAAKEQLAEQLAGLDTNLYRGLLRDIEMSKQRLQHQMERSEPPIKLMRSMKIDDDDGGNNVDGNTNGNTNGNMDNNERTNDSGYSSDGNSPSLIHYRRGALLENNNNNNRHGNQDYYIGYMGGDRSRTAQLFSLQ